MANNGDPADISNDKQNITILNRDNEKETINFSSDEMLESVQLEDSTVEVVGFLDEIDGPKIVGKAKHYRLLKFILNNNSHHRIQVVVWNNEIERVQFHLKPNQIIHIDGAKAKAPLNSIFNQGTLPYELVVNRNTLINNLGTFDLLQVINAAQAKLIELNSIPDHLNSCVRKYLGISLRRHYWCNIFTISLSKYTFSHFYILH
ncbi:PREDICTED: uncharacterized protein LOC105557513, partial [Vollenhovia emeryi]|uniref:uncharacterized protein LOC105557513 n=1 Tax=Vollenhovia emeryi TaxID=411798 RepID=UPI0005F472F2